jgi:hypothetical protein
MRSLMTLLMLTVLWMSPAQADSVPITASSYVFHGLVTQLFNAPPAFSLGEPLFGSFTILNTPVGPLLNREELRVSNTRVFGGINAPGTVTPILGGSRIEYIDGLIGFDSGDFPGPSPSVLGIQLVLTFDTPSLLDFTQTTGGAVVATAEQRAGGEFGLGGTIDQVAFAPVPEPASLALMTTALGSLLLRLRNLNRLCSCGKSG